MLKSEKTHRAGTVLLWIGIILAIVTLAAGFVHCTKYAWMPFELIFEMPFEILLEYVLIGAGLTLIFLGIAWICYGVASHQAKRETDIMYGEDDYCFEEEDTCEVDVAPATPKKKPSDTVKEWKDKVVAVAKDEKVQKVGKIVLPAVAACIVTAAVAAAAQSGQKAKRRREFYRWLG
ncbi:MAG: hypothetical protein IJW55_00635 [Clostridia bacterium]|nr:hypothetical protein [Clostridia bacterium]